MNAQIILLHIFKQEFKLFIYFKPQHKIIKNVLKRNVIKQSFFFQQKTLIIKGWIKQ